MAQPSRERAPSARRPPLKEVKFAKDGSNIPLYLQKVKSAMAEEERVVAHRLGLDRDPDVPPGHRKLTDSERLEILAGLHSKKVDLEAKQSRLPLQLDTQGQKQRARELEQALRQADLDIARFSKQTVLLKL